ncbi:MAG: pseudouridine synthase [Bacillota bacterium]|nr:pseudouridine synthase [Bacillota bacterium]
MAVTQRLDKLLSNFGFGTRSEIKRLVKQGLIKVDGETVKDSGMHVAPQSCTVEVEGKILNYREFIYLMMNKPDGVISATWDGKHKTVVDLLPEEFRCFDLFPVGRLDIDTEGLVIMTNDGRLAHGVLSPRKHVSKKYYALIDGNVTQSDIDAFAEGITLDDGYKTLPARLEILSSGENSEIELVIYEGKFHQVKRMFEATGKKVKFLKRVEMGDLKLDESLELGSCREMTPDEINILKNSQPRAAEGEFIK